jgi:hypothetical protein
MPRLREYFTDGTQGTKTGGMIGIEVETDFITRNGRPLDEDSCRQILASTDGRPLVCQQKLELGRQKLEVSVAPQPTFELALEATLESLDWLYRQAAQYGAWPRFSPEVEWPGDLLFVQEERDQIWVDLDGRRALEELCRCSSIQLTVDINPADAIAAINLLQGAKLHQYDYAANHQRWLNYINLSAAQYQAGRYGGPERFEDLDDYCDQLAQYRVVMHQGQPVSLPPETVADLNIDLFLRSVWWHYRLRRFGHSLALEIRPFSRRDDDMIAARWQLVKETLGL